MKSIFFFNLKKFLNFLDCSIYILVSKKERKIVLSNTELLIICISSSEQGKNYGSFLIKESLENFKEFFSHYNGIIVKTLKRINKILLFMKKMILKKFLKFMAELILNTHSKKIFYLSTNIIYIFFF